MSELINISRQNQRRRWKLLATASAFALQGSATAIGAANASSVDADHPTVWIEVGGQLNRLEDEQERLAPSFIGSVLNAGFDSPLPLERAPLYSIDEEGKISIQPRGSDWVFSASVQIGRTSGKRYRSQQTNEIFYGLRTIQPNQARFRYAETTTSSAETHTILDFMAGRDVGLGVFGLVGTSALSGGVRIAQFQSRSSAAMYADPDYARSQGSGLPHKYFHNYGAHGQNRTSFIGVGPALSWDASLPVHGDTEDGQVSFDFGLNGAVLFGRQKSKGSHQTNGKLSTGFSFPNAGIHYNTTHYTHLAPHDRSQRVTVPNIGAMTGLSFRYSDARISVGYRVDEFFGAMDGGMDTHKRYNFGMSGPFATISIGLGR